MHTDGTLIYDASPVWPCGSSSDSPAEAAASAASFSFFFLAIVAFLFSIANLFFSAFSSSVSSTLGFLAAVRLGAAFDMASWSFCMASSYSAFRLATSSATAARAASSAAAIATSSSCSSVSDPSAAALASLSFSNSALAARAND